MKKFSVLIAAGAIGLLTAGTGYAQAPDVAEAQTVPAPAQEFLMPLNPVAPTNLYMTNMSWFGPASVTVKRAGCSVTDTIVIPPNGTRRFTAAPYDPRCTSASVEVTSDSPEQWLKIATDSVKVTKDDYIKPCEIAMIASAGAETLGFFGNRTILQFQAPDGANVYISAFDPNGKFIGNAHMPLRTSVLQQMPLEELLRIDGKMPYGQLQITTDKPVSVTSTRYSNFRGAGNSVMEKAKGFVYPGPGIFGCE